MNITNWKPFYQKRGKYVDGRDRICISWYEGNQLKKTLMLPKPEDLKEILLEKGVPLHSTQKTTKLKENDV